MTDTKKSAFSSFGVLAAGIAVAAVAYFWAKPAHQGTSPTPVANVANAAKAPAAAQQAPVTDATPAAAETQAAMAAKPDAVIFFDSGKSTLPASGGKSLEAVIAKMKLNTNTKAVISGYNDATGDKEKNALLSKERAKSVREALRSAGVAGDGDARIDMRKPDETMGGVDAEAARRVEVTVL